MHSFRLRLAVAIIAMLVSLGGAVAALHSISESGKADPTPKMYEDLNAAFVKHWKTRTGVDVTVSQAKTISGFPVRVSVEGLKVVSLAVSYDPDALHGSTKFTLPHWQNLLPHNTPFASTIVFLVRKGNPKNLLDWSDLARPGVQVITSDPKTSNSARWNYMAAWGYGLVRSGRDESKAFDFVRKLFANVTVRNPDTRESVSTFVQHGIGDVLLAWECEAHQIAQAQGADTFEVVVPSTSILAELAVSVVNGIDDKTGSREVAEAYVDYLFSTKAQDIAGKHYYRPRDEKIAAKYARQLPPIDFYTIDEISGGWKAAQATHFADGGIFDQIQSKAEL